MIAVGDLVLLKETLYYSHDGSYHSWHDEVGVIVLVVKNSKFTNEGHSLVVINGKLIWAWPSDVMLTFNP
jgi:hypothetical protein